MSLNVTLEGIRRRLLYCRPDKPCSQCEAKAQADFAKIRRTYAAKSTPLRQTAEGKHVSAHNKSGSSKCSAAASNWRLRKATHEDHVMLAQCRAAAATGHAAHLHRMAGNEQKAQHLERIAGGIDRGSPVSGKARSTKAKQLVVERAAKNQAKATSVANAATATPSVSLSPAKVSPSPSPSPSPATHAVPPSGTLPPHLDSLRRQVATHAHDKAAKLEATAKRTNDPDLVRDARDMRAVASKAAAIHDPAFWQEQSGAGRSYGGILHEVHGHQSAVAPAAASPDVIPFKAKPASPTASPSTTTAPSPSPAPISDQIAHHRAEASRHEDLAAKHGKAVKAFEDFTAKGKAPSAGQRATADRAASARIAAHHEAARHHAEANRLAGGAGAADRVSPVVTAPASKDHKDRAGQVQRLIAKVRERSAAAGKNRDDALAAKAKAEAMHSLGHGKVMPQYNQASVDKLRAAHAKASARANRLDQHAGRIVKAASGETATLNDATKAIGKKLAAEDRAKDRADSQFGDREAEVRKTMVASSGLVRGGSPKGASSPQSHVPVPHPLDSKTFADRVTAAAATVGPEGRFANGKKVFISHAHAAYEKAHGPISLGEFKAKLLRAQNERHIDMRRADMVEAMDPHAVKASNTQAIGTGQYHFILADHKVKVVRRQRLH